MATQQLDELFRARWRTAVDDDALGDRVDPRARQCTLAESARQQFGGDDVLEIAQLLAAGLEAFFALEIGGADNPVVKDAFGLPYIPGSSLRGRIRSLLENAMGLTTAAELVYLSKRRGQEVRIHQSDRADDEICLLFGRNPGRVERVEGA